MHWKTIRHARRFRTIKAPFFPRYLFVSLDLQRDRWRSVNGTYGVSALLMGGDLPKPVPEGIVERLLEYQDGSGAVAVGSALRPGQQVRVLSGPFAEMIGQLVRVDDVHRVQVLLELMGTRIVVQMPGRVLAAS
jgi:transcriptional antiterminator RfaH